MLMDAPKNAYAVILAGGGGTRLWPKSRQKTPKHLVSIVSKETIIQFTYKRILPLIPKERVYVITRDTQADLVREQLPDLPKENIIEEPASRNTALAMGVAAVFIHRKDPDAVLTYLAADHVITDEEKYRQTVASALQVAGAGDYIVAVGIKPTFAHSGLGYIKVGAEIFPEGVSKQVYVFKGDGFKEKPDAATAQSFIATGKYLWNANLYNWSSKSIFKAFKDHAPKVSGALSSLLESSSDADFKKKLGKIYEEADSDPIDLAISEKVDNLVVIPGDFGWSDVGDWKVVYDTLSKDAFGNVVAADNVLSIDTFNCLIEGNGRLIATIGLKDICIIDTKDALLVCHKSQAQAVKRIVEQLKERKEEGYL